MRYVDIYSVKEGTILACGLLGDSSKELLLAARTPLTRTMIERLKKLGIQGVFVEDA